MKNRKIWIITAILVAVIEIGNVAGMPDPAVAPDLNPTPIPAPTDSSPAPTPLSTGIPTVLPTPHYTPKEPQLIKVTITGAAFTVPESLRSEIESYKQAIPESCFSWQMRID